MTIARVCEYSTGGNLLLTLERFSLSLSLFTPPILYFVPVRVQVPGSALHPTSGYIYIYMKNEPITTRHKKNTSNTPRWSVFASVRNIEYHFYVRPYATQMFRTSHDVRLVCVLQQQHRIACRHLHVYIYIYISASTTYIN